MKPAAPDTIPASVLLAEVEAFCTETGVPRRSFGQRATGSQKLFWNLRQRQAVTAGLAARVRAFMSDYRGDPRSELPRRATGAEMVAAIRVEAKRRKTTPLRLVRALTSAPSHWLAQLEASSRPTDVTRARVIALLTDQPIPPAPRKGHAQPTVSTSVNDDAGSISVLIEPPVPAVLPFERRTCLWCGVRSDIGCCHLGYPEQVAA